MHSVLFHSDRPRDMMESSSSSSSSSSVSSSLHRTEEISLLNEKKLIEKEEIDDVQSFKQKKLLGFECQEDHDGITNFGSWISSRFGVIEEEAIGNLTQELDDAYYRESGSWGFQNKKMAVVDDGDNSEKRISVGGIRSCSSVTYSSCSFQFSYPMNCSSSYNEKKLDENIDGEQVSQLRISKNEVGDDDDDSQKSKVIFHASDIEQLHMRLQMLEEDYQLMKKEFVTGVEERCELLSEISSHFHNIQQHLRSRVTGGRPLEGSSVISSNKDGSIGIGLSQVLHQASSPPLVTRVLKANNFTFQVLEKRKCC